MSIPSTVPTPAVAPRRELGDGVAIVTSLLCLVHCLALPLVVVLLPVTAAWLVLPERVHEVALLVAVPASVAALAAGRRRHRDPLPVLVAAPGLALLALGAWGLEGDAETAASAAGAVLVAGAHLVNLRLSAARA